MSTPATTLDVRWRPLRLGPVESRNRVMFSAHSTWHEPDRRTIPGLGTTTVLDPATAIADPARCGDAVLIVDDHGAHTSLGLAELLARDGRRVELLTARGQIGHRAERFDSIVLCQTRRAEDALYDRLRETGLPVEPIGDAYAPRDVDEVIYAGAISGRKLRPRKGRIR